MKSLRKILFTVVLCSIIVCSASAYKVLVVFPIPGMSHSILGNGYVKLLLEAGHEVTYMTPLPMKEPAPNLRQIELKDNFKVCSTKDFFNLEKLMKNEIDLHSLSELLIMMYKFANTTLMTGDVQTLLHDPTENFDVVISEWMYNELYAGFSGVFGCPLIWSSSLEPHHMVLSIIDEAPNMAYTADVFSSNAPPFNFWKRAEKLWNFVSHNFDKWMVSGVENEIFEKGFREATVKRGRVWSPLSEARLNGSLMLGNSHVSLGQAVRLPQNYIPIAGYHIDTEVKPLPQEMQKIMDSAKHGVIYFSMGSMLQSSKLPQEVKRGLLDVFGGLKQTVIWKYEELTLPDRPSNVHIVQWAPQQSILAHPNCILFITHGGLLSTTESVHFGVPLIGIPMFADQFNNVDRYVQKGFAKRVDLNFETPVKLKAVIQEMLVNPRQKVKELSLIYHDRPVSPGRELVHWVEHVVRTRGSPHLRSPALHMPFYQKMYLDLAAVVLIVLINMKKIIKSLFSRRTRKSSKKNN